MSKDMTPTIEAPADGKPSDAQPTTGHVPSSTAAAPVLVEVAVADLICDERTQVRAAESEEAIESYAEAMKNGAKFPPPIVFRDEDGNLWVSEGHHTIKASRRRGVERIMVDLRQGTAKDARMHAYASNWMHGVQLTLADKTRIVRGLIEDTDWSNRKIADHVRFLSHEKIRLIRRQMKGETTKKPRTPNATPAKPSCQSIKATKGVAPSLDGIVWQERLINGPMPEEQLQSMLSRLAAEAEQTPYAVCIDTESGTVTFATKTDRSLAFAHCRILRSAAVPLPTVGEGANDEARAARPTKSSTPLPISR